MLHVWAVLAAVPNPPPSAPPGLAGPATTFLGWVKWGGLIAGMIGLMVCGIMMMIGRRNRSATAVDGATGIPWVVAGLTVITLSSGLVGAVLT